MKRYLTLILLSGLFTLSCAQNKPVEITFQIESEVIDDTTEVFITGNQTQLGNWHPGKVKMKNLGNHIWQITLTFKQNTHLEYKITLGSFENEAAQANGLPFPNSVLDVKKKTTIKKKIHFWKNGSNINVAGQVTGTVKYHKQLKVEGLLPRDVVVWLPPDYEKNNQSRYPVLYMQDGQNIFDPQTAAFKVDWQIDESCDSLINAGKIEPLIVVGIYNTYHRSDEYTPTEVGDLYRQFVVDIVKPLIDKTYRTKPGRDHTVVGGSSAGGIVSFMLAWENPKIFSKAICMSPAFKISSIDYVDDVEDYEGPKKPLTFYIDNGGKELEIQLHPGILDMLEALDEKGYKKGVDYYWLHDKEALHNEAAWAKRMPKVLELFWGK